jgi:glycosyltransferase involved in cell wall biosynthesis
MRICFYIGQLCAAGAERVLSLLANELAAEGCHVVILTLESSQEKPFYELSPSIEVRQLDLARESRSLFSALANNLHRVRRLRQAIREARPDVVISFIDKANILSVLATRGLGIPIIISERTDPSKRSLGGYWTLLRDLAYPRADLLVCQSRAVLEWFPRKVRDRGTVIPNPVFPAPPPGVQAPAGPRPRRVASMGRLFPVKGFDVLLEAFALAGRDSEGWELVIWGRGPDREALEQQARELGISGSVHFMGVTDQPFEALYSADLFVLPSRAEGFPNALVEAMACRRPVIATDFGGAVRDIIREDVDGLLVPSEDPAALAAAMVRLMRDPAERERLAARAPEVVERFSRERVFAQWRQAIQGVLRPAARRSGEGPSRG